MSSERRSEEGEGRQQRRRTGATSLIVQRTPLQPYGVAASLQEAVAAISDAVADIFNPTPSLAKASVEEVEELVDRLYAPVMMLLLYGGPIYGYVSSTAISCARARVADVEFSTSPAETLLRIIRTCIRMRWSEEVEPLDGMPRSRAISRVAYDCTMRVIECVIESAQIWGIPKATQ